MAETTQYSVIVGSEAGDGPVHRSVERPHELIDRPVGSSATTMYDIFALGGLRMRPHAPCFGSRVSDSGAVGAYDWQSYAEVSRRVDHLAAALWRCDLVPETSDNMRLLGLYLKNSRDWMVTALACYRLGVTVVPMYDTLGADTVAYIQRQTHVATVVCTQAELPVLLANCPFANVIVTGAIEPALRERCIAAGLNLLGFSKLEATGAQVLVAEPQMLAQLPPPASYSLLVSRFCFAWLSTLPFVLLKCKKRLMRPVIQLRQSRALGQRRQQ